MSLWLSAVENSLYLSVDDDEGCPMMDACVLQINDIIWTQSDNRSEFLMEVFKDEVPPASRPRDFVKGASHEAKQPAIRKHITDSMP